MIEPIYRRDQLWGPARRGIHPAIVLGACVGAMAALLAFTVPRMFVFVDDSRPERARLAVRQLAFESFPEWRQHHAGCPHRLADLPGRFRLDPWGHAMHYTCDRRLGLGAHFAVISAGEDGRFGTADDIEAHQ